MNRTTANGFGRRELLASSLGMLGVTLPVTAAASAGQAGAMGGPIARSLEASVDGEGNYALPPLPYAPEALEPSIDAETMSLHHDKHHAAYVRGANEALAKLAAIRGGALETAGLSDWTEKLAFNASGHLLHAVFWAGMGPDGGKPEGALVERLERDFGGVESFKSHFSGVSTSVQGNGWGVLGLEPVSRGLMVLQARNHQVNVVWNVIPLLVLDMWEHAYYLKYRNVRADYVKGFWDVVNWKAVGAWYELLDRRTTAACEDDAQTPVRTRPGRSQRAAG